MTELSSQLRTTTPPPEQIANIGICKTTTEIKKKSIESTSDGGQTLERTISVRSELQQIDIYGMNDKLESYKMQQE